MGLEQKDQTKSPRNTEAEKLLIRLSPVSASTWQDGRKVITLPEELSGIKILDIGGGGSDMTARAIEQGADAYAVDPRYKSRSDLKGQARKNIERIRQLGDHGYYRESLAALDHCMDSIKQHPERYKAGSATELPFGDNTFDIAYSIAAVLGYLDLDLQTLTTATQEALRVIKPGGELQLFPLTNQALTDRPEEKITREQTQSKWLKWLDANQSLTYQIEPTTTLPRVVIHKK